VVAVVVVMAQAIKMERRQHLAAVEAMAVAGLPELAALVELQVAPVFAVLEECPVATPVAAAVG
jgi:hypothetical protein